MSGACAAAKMAERIFLVTFADRRSRQVRGLDFHWYSRAIVHWNPTRSRVDFERREGRPHRLGNSEVRRKPARNWLVPL